jgi:hypothetical protein
MSNARTLPPNDFSGSGTWSFMTGVPYTTAPSINTSNLVKNASLIVFSYSVRFKRARTPGNFDWIACNHSRRCRIWTDDFQINLAHPGFRLMVRIPEYSGHPFRTFRTLCEVA